jgi:hypothetical protein
MADAYNPTMTVADELILERLTAREAQLHDQANALDVKASILLVGVVFLAGQSTYLLTKYAAGFWRWEQFLSVFLQFAAAAIMARLLWIRVYDGECAEDYLQWRDKNVRHFGEHGTAQVEPHMRTKIIQGCKDRIDKARDLNDGKVKLVKAVYVLTLLAFLCNLVALIAPLF